MRQSYSLTYLRNYRYLHVPDRLSSSSSILRTITFWRANPVACREQHQQRYQFSLAIEAVPRLVDAHRAARVVWNKSGQQAVRRAADAARSVAPVADDVRFTSSGTPGRAHPLRLIRRTGIPPFWIVPFLTSRMVCGFARVDTSGKVVQVSTLGSGPDDRVGWVSEEWFAHPPPDVLEEIRRAHPEGTIAQPVLSYDRTPARWGWKVDVLTKTGERIRAFIGTGGWCQASSRERDDREG
jgi:hypothetical protein